MNAQHAASQAALSGNTEGKDDDDVPDVVENFDEDEKKGETEVDKLD